MAPPNPDALFKCRRLDCTLRRRVCVARQVVAELEILGSKTTTFCQRRADPNRPVELARHDGKRGVPSSDFLMCLRCPQGARIREQLGDEVAASVRRGDRGPGAFRAWAAHQRELPPGEIRIIDHVG